VICYNVLHCSQKAASALVLECYGRRDPVSARTWNFNFNFKYLFIYLYIFCVRADATSVHTYGLASVRTGQHPHRRRSVSPRIPPRPLGRRCASALQIYCGVNYLFIFYMRTLQFLKVTDA
jgi:hypothetical protein